MELKTCTKDLISKLATEVLGHIFVHCLPPESEPISLKSGPLLLVQVCHRWREVAFGTPSLWQNIQLKRIWPEGPIFILDLFLAKSRNLPLTITLPYEGLDGTAEQQEAVMNRVLDDFHRVLSLKGNASRLFAYCIFQCLSAVSAPRHIHAPLLQHLNITDFDRSAELPEEMARKYVHSCIIAPNLEELHLDGSGFMFSMVRFSPESLKVLVGLFINGVAQICDMSFLCKTVNLATLEFHVSGSPADTVLKFPSSVYLPNLKYLTILIDDTQFGEKVIHSLHCPAIEELVLDVNTSFPNVVECLTKGQTPPLRSLSTNIFSGTPLSSYYRFKDIHPNESAP